MSEIFSTFLQLLDCFMFDLQILCFPLMGNLTRSSWGFVQMNTNGESDSPFGNCSRYSSWPRTSVTSTHPSKQPVGRSGGKFIRSTENCWKGINLRLWKTRESHDKSKINFRLQLVLRFWRQNLWFRNWKCVLFQNTFLRILRYESNTREPILH